MKEGLAFGNFLKVVVKKFSANYENFKDSTNSEIILDNETTNYLGINSLSNSFNF